MRNIKQGVKQKTQDLRPKFSKHAKVKARHAKIKQLDLIARTDSNMSVRVAARKERKGMLTFRIGRTKVNTTGFYEKSGKHPVRCKAKNK
jgi:hypothetical protein